MFQTNHGRSIEKLKLHLLKKKPTVLLINESVLLCIDICIDLGIVVKSKCCE